MLKKVDLAVPETMRVRGLTASHRQPRPRSEVDIADPKAGRESSLKIALGLGGPFNFIGKRGSQFREQECARVSAMTHHIRA